jgi:hypothetical protein
MYPIFAGSANPPPASLLELLEDSKKEHEAGKAVALELSKRLRGVEMEEGGEHVARITCSSGTLIVWRG